ncbi:MAG: adenosylmethionine--8-amino-7-oxononanoate transaminase [Nitrospinota bacterium]
MAEESRRERLESLDMRHLWHPFTQMKGWQEEEKLIVERGEGAYLFDVEGRRYLDGVASLWVNLHGHRHPAIDGAIREQLGRVAHTTQLGLASPQAIKLAARLVAISPPGLTRVFYSDDGATAVEVALKMAYQYQLQRRPPRPEKRKFIRLALAYHGDTLGAVSVGGIERFHALYRPLLFETLSNPNSYCYRCPYDMAYPQCEVHCGRELEDLIARHAEEAAALILEPVIQGAAGMIVQPPGYLRRVRERCKAHDVLLIADEVATGFGRTGRMFACEHEGVSPDFLCLAKGITGGYLPLAATLTTEEVYDAFLGEYAESRTFFHGHSYTGNPLGCAAALANLDIFEKGRTLESLQPKIARLWAELEKLKALPQVGEVRGKGFMVGIELVRDKATKEPFPVEFRAGHRAILAARERGLILRPLGDVIVLVPPYCVTEEEIAWMVGAAGESIEESAKARAGSSSMGRAGP